MSTALFILQKKEIEEYADNLSKSEEKLNLEGAADFNSFSLLEQQAVLWIYKTKAAQAELKSPLEDKVAGIEETARLYRAQKCAFEDVLTKEGFEPTQEVLKDYSGRIAFLTNHGTLLVLGKPKQKGRLITMARIHTPYYDITHYRSHLTSDLKLGKGPDLTIYKGSEARALAINPHGSDDDEIEGKNACETVYGIGTRTMMLLLNPREHSIVGDK
jgi:hypothetical protein